MKHILKLFKTGFDILLIAAIVFAVFFDDKNVVSNKGLLFMIFLSLVSIIDEKTKGIQKD